MRPWNDHPPTAGLYCLARVNSRSIVYLCDLVEAHEGLAVVRTKDASLGIVEFWISPLMQADFEAFLQALSDEMDISVGPPQEIVLADLESRPDLS